MNSYDLIIKNGTIIDGTQAPRFMADIGIKNGCIEKIGSLTGESALRTIDAEGKIVAPGVIDTHTHYDAQMFWDPYLTNSSWHGTTSVTVGNCGFGFMPCRESDRERYMKMMEATEQVPLNAMQSALPWTWESFPEWMAAVRAIPKGINVSAYLPLNSLMMYVMGVEAAKTRPATASERAEMRRLLHEAMDAGAVGFGFSFLQNYNSHKDFDGSPMPTDSMQIEEAYNLCRVLKERGEGVVQALMEIPGMPESNRAQCEELARLSGRPVLFNVVVALDVMPDFHRDTLAWLDEVRAKQLPIYAQALCCRIWVQSSAEDFTVWDAHPLFAAFTAADREGKIAMASDPDYRSKVREWYQPEKFYAGGGPLENWVITDACGSSYAKYEGQTIAAIAEQHSACVTDTFWDMVVATEAKLGFKNPPSLSVDPVKVTELLSHPQVIPGTSDGGAHVKISVSGHYQTDFIDWLVREQNMMSLEQMHYKSSYLPARLLGFEKRGALLEGYAADIMVYDFEKINYNQERYDRVEDLPGGDWRWVVYAEGIDNVIVNGEVIFTSNGACTGAHPGRMLNCSGAMLEQIDDKAA
ncbi:amidohydrolase family protein [Spongiibacter sp. KMU-166]|uniref:Amidohydrolase family protein n=1 Tax=Spongiibacter thalassae TaxID=2721624 RepID=A0ABX1G9J7_9GAMM|nr:amidohydrolase family protein [Spongiibacter thalassae]NKI15829.1 amidohydrolase family protein [Spongiibacter thalassae]